MNGMRLLTRASTWLIVAIIVVVFVVPYLWMAGSAFKPQADIFRDVSPVTIWTILPRTPTLENFVTVFRDQNLGRYLMNSTIVAVAQVVGTVMISASAAFALARVAFKGREKVFIFILATFLIPFDAIVIPLFMTVRGLGLQGSFTAYWLPWIFSPFGIFLLKQMFEEIPKELDEAATVDGATPFQIFWRICLPNAVPGIVTLSLITFLHAWDSFFWPLVASSEESKQLLTVFIAKQITANAEFWGSLFAAVFVGTVPVVALFLMLQKHYVRGIASSGLKG